MRILFIGDVVGQVGIKKIAKHLPKIKEEYGFHFCVVNAENAADGLGITSSQARELLSLGIDCITLGNHSFAKFDVLKFLGEDNRIIRPANGLPTWPGKGHAFFIVNGIRILVINLQGQVFLSTPISPFLYMSENLEKLKKEYNPQIILVDFHAEASSEKIAMAHFLDGNVSILVGTHTHIQTADERIMEKGLAYITDVGMTGPWNSVIGMDIGVARKRFLEGMPARYVLSSSPACLSAILVDVNPSTGHSVQIMRYLDRPNFKGVNQWIKS